MDMPKAPREARRTNASRSSTQGAAAHEARARVRHAFWWALASGTLLWAAFPPLNGWPLAWLAPLGWLQLIRLPQLPGRRPYLGIWLAGLLHWLALLQGVRLAHPALYLGWIALAAYVAVYPLLFVALTRVAVHRLRISIILSAPAIWTGLELVRGHALTGFSIALLGHTQIPWTALIQIADVCGAYGVSFVVMGGAACLLRLWNAHETQRRWTLWPLLPLAAGLAAVLGYGVYRQPAADDDASREPAVRGRAHSSVV